MNIESSYYVSLFSSSTDWYLSTTNGVLNSIVTDFNPSHFENQMFQKIPSLRTISLRFIMIHFQGQKLAHLSNFFDFTQICYVLYYAMLFSAPYNNKPIGKSNYIAQNQDFKKYLLVFHVEKQKFAVVSVPTLDFGRRQSIF